MDKPMEKVSIKGTEYPIKCSNYVLAQIQEKYGSISDFEMALAGKKEIFDKDGKPKTDKNGKKLYTNGEPDINAILFMLPLCVNEGIEIEADELNKEAKLLKEKYIIRNIDIGVLELAVKLRTEFYRAIIAKK